MVRLPRAAAAVWLLAVLASGAAGVSGPQSALAAAESAPAPQASRPRVRLVATGGTISLRPGGRLSHEELAQLVPDLARYVEAESEQFANATSASLTLGQWLHLSRRLNELFDRDPLLAGIVVTSGTDTLEELAYFLNLTVRADRPVVVVGAMRAPGTIGYDGAANLRDAFRVAAHPASRGRGTLVVFNGEINAAREVAKTDALRLQTFQSRPYGLLGVVDADEVVYYRDTVRRHTKRSEFAVNGLDTLPRVDIVMVYQGASGDLIRAAVDAGARGLVIASAGAGAVSGTQAEALGYATRRGVHVVMSTRAGSGRIAPRQPGRSGEERDGSAEEARERAFRVAAEDLAPLKARVLLMLALTKTNDRDEIQRMFTEY
jgi:L-asparaginase